MACRTAARSRGEQGTFAFRGTRAVHGHVDTSAVRSRSTIHGVDMTMKSLLWAAPVPGGAVHTNEGSRCYTTATCCGSERPGRSSGPVLHLVGVAGFEPTAPRSQSECATKLRYTPSGPSLCTPA